MRTSDEPIRVTVRWYAGGTAAALDRLAADLDAGERRHLARLRQAKDRWAYAAAHALIRRMLSDRYGAPPQSWRFTKDAHDRPHMDQSFHTGFDPPFSVSHTEGLAICALVADAAGGNAIRVGVDAEARGDAEIEEHEIAARFFAPREVALLRAQPPTHQRDAFYDLWTLKEAIAKAVGLGLTLSLSSFACCLTPPTVASTDPALQPIAGWTLRMLDLGAGHAGALAIKHAPGQAIDIRCAAAGDGSAP